MGKGGVAKCNEGGGMRRKMVWGGEGVAKWSEVEEMGRERVWSRGRGRGGCGQGADRGGWVGRVDKWMCWYTVHHTHTQGSKCFQAANM